MQQPPSIQRVQESINEMMAHLSRRHLIPTQKEAFLCCARCCDTVDSAPEHMQSCVEDCSNKSLQQQKLIQQSMSDFQARFQRCAERCRDNAQELAGLDPSPSDIKRAQASMESCADGCGKEFVGKVPKLKTDLEKQLQRLHSS